MLMAPRDEGHLIVMTETLQLPGIDRVLRLSKRVTGHEYAGVSLIGLSPATSDDGPSVTLDVRDPLISATLAHGAVYEEPDIHAPGSPPLRSFAGVRLCGASGAPLGTLWVGSGTPHRMDETDTTALADLGALLEAELDRRGQAGLAAEVQRRLLPVGPPPITDLDMAADCRPAQEVGGDFYDWWRTGGSLQLVVADVMGKGVPAAIVASAIRAMLHAALTFNRPATALRRVGGDLQSDLDQLARFATCFTARLNLTTHTVTYADAGHGLAVILRGDGTVSRLNSTDLPLGVMPDATWQEQETTLGPGEMLLAVSDGVLDLFETTAACLDRALELHRSGARAADYVAELVNDRTAADPDDDLTVVAIGRMAS